MLGKFSPARFFLGGGLAPRVEILSASQRAQIRATPKSAPQSALRSALRNRGALEECSQECSWGVLFLLFTTEITHREHSPESTLGSTFGGFPDLGPLAGRQNLNSKGEVDFASVDLQKNGL